MQGYIPTGIEKLIELAKQDHWLTPEVVRRGNENAKLVLMLADIYQEGHQFDKSLRLCTRLIEGAAPKPTREQESYAYYRRARDYYKLPGEAFNPDAALADYIAAAAAAPRAEWADSAMFLAGNLEWNDRHDGAAAIAIWRRLLRDHPKSAEADRCEFFIGLVYHFSKQYPEAQKSLQKFLADYPDSDFAESARRVLGECDAKLAEQHGKRGK